MKKMIVAAALLLSTRAGAQNTLYAGGWNTGTSNRFTRITVTDNLPSRIYRIESTTMMDADALHFNVIVDGVTIPGQLPEGGYVVVEGKSIAIQQIAPGRLVRANWKVVQLPDVAFEAVPWVGYPSLNRDVVVAALKTEQEFVLSIFRDIPNCTGAAMTVYVDGNPVRDGANNVLVFPEGSSVVGKGKTVAVRVAGTCTGLNTVNGDLRLRK